MSLSDAKPFGCLNQRTSRALKRLAALPGVNIKGIVTRSVLEKARTQWRQSGKTATMSLDVSVYGPLVGHVAKLAARTLSDAKLFLQFPRFATKDFPYDNPQYLKLPNVSHVQLEDTLEINSPAPIQNNDEHVSRSELDSVLDHIPQPKFLRQASTSVRIRTPLMKYASDQTFIHLLTLRRYQKEAVDFITRRETGDLPPSMSLWKPCSPPGDSFWWVLFLCPLVVSR
jgi:SWI/SNF-related matrix-associated actin-dependent regulator of chromatin subfamily A3